MTFISNPMKFINLTTKYTKDSQWVQGPEYFVKIKACGTFYFSQSRQARKGKNNLLFLCFACATLYQCYSFFASVAPLREKLQCG